MQPETKVMQSVTVTQGTPSLRQSSVVGYLNKYNKIFFPQHTSTGTDCVHRKHQLENNVFHVYGQFLRLHVEEKIQNNKYKFMIYLRSGPVALTA
jgi:hypothetical protein